MSALIELLVSLRWRIYVKPIRVLAISRIQVRRSHCRHPPPLNARTPIKTIQTTRKQPRILLHLLQRAGNARHPFLSTSSRLRMTPRTIPKNPIRSDVQRRKLAKTHNQHQRHPPYGDRLGRREVRSRIPDQMFHETDI